MDQKGMDVEIMSGDGDFWATMLPKLRAFYVRGIVAELFAQRIKRWKSLYPPGNREVTALINHSAIYEAWYDALLLSKLNISLQRRWI